MGNCRSKHIEEETTQQSEQLGFQVEQVCEKPQKECRILILGSSESGKSTIVKQMYIIHRGGFSRKTKLTYREAIYFNVLESAQAVATAMSQFEVNPADSSNVPTLERVLGYNLDAELQSQTRESAYVFPQDLAHAIHRLWKDQAVGKFVGDYESYFYLMDNAGYFLTEARRIASADYVPTEMDILLCWQRSTGISETRFSHPPLSIHLFDVGGRRSERKKWIHCFEGATAVIFCVAISEYDQVLPEDNDQNRVQESLVLFNSLTNSRWFRRTPFILFLNKVDIFRHKIHRVPLELYFQEYTGGPDVDNGTEYILQRFRQANEANLRMYPHITQATDTSNVRLVLSAVTDTIVNNLPQDTSTL